MSTEYLYVRVSTDDQALSVEAQSATLLSRYPAGVVVTDVGVSGTVPLDERPGFSSIQFEAGDTLVAVRLDRIARSTIEAVALLDRFKAQGVDLVLFDLGLDFTSPSGRLVYSVLAAVAAFERDMISERTKEALYAKRDPSIEEAIEATAGLPSRKASKVIRETFELDVSPSTIQRRRRALA